MIYVARHGQTQYNVKGLVSGRGDVPLTEVGYQQAAQLAEEVSSLTQPVTSIIHSPLQRAQETARIVAEKNHLPMTVDERLLELDYGSYDGQKSATAAFQAARLAFNLRFPEGESVMDAYARVVPLLIECLADKENTYLLVCHNSLIRCIQGYFEPMTNEEFFNFKAENAKLIAYLS